MAAEFGITREYRGNTLVLAVHGELDIHSAPALERALRDAEAAGRDRLVIDLSGVEFMDSTGLQTIIRARQRSLAECRELSLVRGPRQVQRLFELTGTVEKLAFGPG